MLPDAKEHVEKVLVDTPSLERVVVVGTSCSGKTTFATDLAKRLSVKHIEFDSIQWQPNWQPLPLDDFRSRVLEKTSAERWVIDGNYSSVPDIVWPRATTLIWLNYSFRIVAYRALSRTLRRAISREVLWAGNVESFRISFLSSDSILWWVVKTYHRRRREYPLLFNLPSHDHLQVIELSSPIEAERYVQSISLTY